MTTPNRVNGRDDLGAVRGVVFFVPLWMLGIAAIEFFVRHNGKTALEFLVVSVLSGVLLWPIALPKFKRL